MFFIYFEDIQAVFKGEHSRIALLVAKVVDGTGRHLIDMHSTITNKALKVPSEGPSIELISLSEFLELDSLHKDSANSMNSAASHRNGDQGPAVVMSNDGTVDEVISEFWNEMVTITRDGEDVVD